MIYVDDILLISSSQNQIKRIIKYFSLKFEVKNLGDAKYCLGLEFTRNKDGITITQKAYIKDVLEKFGILNCNSVSTPMDPSVDLSKAETTSKKKDLPYRELVGALMYLFIGTRPDIPHSVSQFKPVQ